MSARPLMGACDACLRRAHLVGFLAGRIAALLDRPGRRPPGLLALKEDDLIQAVAGERADEAFAFLERFEPRPARAVLEGARMHAACPHDDSYPSGLRQLGDPPAVLFGVGEAGGLSRLSAEPSVALVGSRRPSEYGKEMAYGLGRGMGAARVPVVSGLALGIDAAAHRGCLDAGGFPVAVLGCGADVPYPRTNRALYRRVREEGIVLSELPPGQPPFRWSFPARNRIMAGLAATTVVVEAADPSGSLITSVFAADLGRTVAAVPGRATSHVARGSNGLLKSGALVVTGPEDLLDELFGADARPVRRVDAPDRAIDPLERAVLEGVETGLTVDGICAAAGLPAREARAVLARLEAEGLLRQDELGRYRRTLETGLPG